MTFDEAQNFSSDFTKYMEKGKILYALLKQTRHTQAEALSNAPHAACSSELHLKHVAWIFLDTTPVKECSVSKTAFDFYHVSQPS